MCMELRCDKHPSGVGNKLHGLRVGRTPVIIEISLESDIEQGSLIHFYL